MGTTESVIRQMTRLAVRHQAVNLAQGFTDEAPPYPMVWAAVAALVGGTDAGIDRLQNAEVGPLDLVDPSGESTSSLEQILEALQNPRDALNQYSFPFGLPELRQAIASYTERWSGFRPDPERETTVVLGATEGLASIFGSVCAPNDGVIVMQPFHEMYPSQAHVFGLRPLYVTLREHAGEWQLDRTELARVAASGARVLVLNTPHNPTGKVFTPDEMEFVASLALEHDLLVVTDEIYEHFVYDGHRHVALAALPGMRERTIIVNSISKTGHATGWRVGWVIAPEPLTARIRAVHDTLVIQAPTPLQKAAVRLLSMPDLFFERLRARYGEKRHRLITAVEQVGFRLATPAGCVLFVCRLRGGATPRGAVAHGGSDVLDRNDRGGDGAWGQLLRRLRPRRAVSSVRLLSGARHAWRGGTPTRRPGLNVARSLDVPLRDRDNQLDQRASALGPSRRAGQSGGRSYSRGGVR